MSGFLVYSQNVFKMEGNAEVLATGAPSRIVSHLWIVGIGYPGVEHGEAARLGIANPSTYTRWRYARDEGFHGESGT